MKHLILIFSLLTISFALFGQDTIQNKYKRQIGLDVKPLINVLSSFTEPTVFSEYEILYTKMLSPKYTFTGKLGYVNTDFYPTKSRRIIPEDSSALDHVLQTGSYLKVHTIFSKKIEKKRINYYWGILAGVNLNQGRTITIEYDTVPSRFHPYNMLSRTSDQKNFLQFTFGPNFGFEFFINDRWQILINSNITATMELGNWEYLGANEKMVTGSVHNGLLYDIQLFSDIGLMYSF